LAPPPDKEEIDMHYRPLTLPALVAVAAGTLLATPAAHADNDNNTLIPNNKRLNDGVVANVYTVQHQAGCTNDVRINPQLQLAAQWHTRDVLNNRNLDGDVGSDGSTPQDRANAAGFHGQVAETVAINPAVAISGIELINQWYYNPAYFAIMSNCANSQVGVWSENSPDRTVVVAVYGPPQQPAGGTRRGTETSPLASQPGQSENIPLDPSPDYDGSDELEFGVNWFPWILRGVYPPPAYPPQ
jgi:cysteine-rich secretory family protein